jgi:hypothetical protein
MGGQNIFCIFFTAGLFTFPLEQQTEAILYFLSRMK